MVPSHRLEGMSLK